MSLDLENIQNSFLPKPKNKISTALKEMIYFLLVMRMVFIYGTVFTNWGTFYDLVVQNFFSPQVNAQENKIVLSGFLDKTIIRNGFDLSGSTGSISNSDLTLNVDEQSLENGAMHLDKYLKTKNFDESFNFIKSIPDNRIIISSININVPIVTPTNVTEEKLAKADFNEELKKGVVNYPTLSDPCDDGTSLIFGHTSDFWTDHNPYGDVFARMGEIGIGDEIKYIWKGKECSYKVTDIKVVTPTKVPDVYKGLTGNHTILMGCWPVFTDKNRKLIIGTRI